MNFQKKKLGLLVMLATVAGVMMPAEAATKLENVKINDSLASQTRIELQFDGPVAAYQERLQYSPEQLVINLNDAESALLKDTMDLNVKAVKGLKVSQNGENLDVVVGLESLVAYEVSQQGNSLFLTLGNDPRVTAATNAVKTPTIVSSEVKGVASGINRINNVNFKKGAKNEGLTVVTLDNKNAALELQKKGTHLLAKFHGTSVVSDFLAIMDVADYSTPIKSIDISENSDGTVLDFAMYNADQYMKPEGAFTTETAADGSKWYKQTPQDTVQRIPYMDANGDVKYNETIVQQLPQIPRRKDRV
jgi:type IV pilus assembly protein PilQ